MASAGVSSPLKIKRQYTKNIGRVLNVRTGSETIEAELTDATEDFIVLEWQSREPKQTGKGKETVDNRREIPYTDIKEAIVTIKF